MQFSVSDVKVDDYFPKLKYSNLLKTLLFQRGLKAEEIEEFLRCEELELEDSSKIFGITKAAKIINEAIEQKKKIIIHGDFDVDGVCSVTILFDYLYFERKADVLPIIPNRADEGYGLSEKTIEKALEAGGDLIITVDCGIKDYDLVEKYKKKIDFIITDHHQFREDENGQILLPKAKAVVHSAHPKSKFSTMISGAATAWQLVREIESLQSSVYSLQSKENVVIPAEAGIQEQDEVDSRSSLDSPLQGNDKVNDYLDLVALSTICDIIPLTKENRKLVQKGIKQIAKTERLGLKKLAEITAIDLSKIETYHFGFVLGPRLNAPGRILNDAMDSVRLLLTKKHDQAIDLAAKLHDLNSKRQDITKKYLEEAEQQINQDKKAIVILGKEWPEGILGLVAGKLAEKYYKPTFVASKNAEGEITGSSRSPLPEFYLVKGLEHAKNHLTRFGGHKSAAGFASEEKLFSGFEEKILEFIEKEVKEEDFVKKFLIDLAIEEFDLINFEVIEELKLLEPHGFGNTKPIFLFPKVRIASKKFFGKDQNHLLLEFQKNGKSLTGKQFNFPQDLKCELDQEVDIAGCLGVNEWNGRKSIEIDIKFIK